MPELPEVEVTRLSLVSRIEQAQILSVRLGKPLRWPLGLDAAALVGGRTGVMERRGKYLWLPVRRAPTAADGGLLLHLGMSGALRFEQALPPAGPHDHFELVTDRGTLRLTDPRRFGAVVWSASRTEGRAAQLLAGLGVEPLEPGFTAAHLHGRLQGRRVSIKQALLAGDVVVGVGNIYCSEALFVAGIDPQLAAGRLSLARCARLVESVQQTLLRALAAGGSTLRDFHDASGHGGAFQQQAQVYGREGLACVRCLAPVQRIVQGQRATYFCPHCQRH
ncbi:MAG: bifunctional DNA-formamidopyrimidine glycosylase/DNA-(apurinic or apyrimidinic site) lyase [Leptothrix sp. (in: b-proteobacteria)]